MRESVIDILFYLFDDILSGQHSGETDLQEMAGELAEAGFSREDVDRALDWFLAFGKLSDSPPNVNDSSLRVFAAREAAFIDAEGQNFLYSMLRAGVLTHSTFEIVIDRALALEEPLDIHTLRWVALMVVLNTGGDALNTWQEQWLFFDEHGTLQ